MSFMQVDHNKAQQGSYMPPEGIYEVIISSMQYNVTQSGTEYLQVKLDIRTDVMQEGMGESINWPIWRKKEPTPMDPDGFPSGVIQSLSRCAGLENGKSYPTMDAWINDLLRKPLRVEIKHNEWNGRVRPRVSYIYETEYPDVRAEAAGFVPVDDAEMPF